MSFIFIGYSACETIVSNHLFQSTEFEQALFLLEFILGNEEEKKINGIFFIRSSRGIYILRDSDTVKKGVVMDLDTFGVFHDKKYTDEEKLTILQKTLKFSVRYWRNLPLTTCEKNVAASNYSVVWPFSFATKRTNRVVLDRRPDEKKMQKRDGNYLFVFDWCYDDKPITPKYNNFRKALELFPNPSSHKSLTEKVTLPDGATPIGITALSAEAASSFSKDSLPFDLWLEYLTKDQKEFVENPVNSCERLEGAAGTGKTLVMILRTINLLRSNTDSANTFRVLFITHSVATKKQIENVFRCIYPSINDHFDNLSSAQLEIITLQEWCIDFQGKLVELEYLDSDAQDSKELQLLYIEESFDEVFAKEFESYKEFLSPGLENFFSETEKGEILEMLQAEIATTIKGRADDNFDAYKKLARFKYGIPAAGEDDLGFIYRIFEKYQEKLELTNQFDSDDIIISSLKQLNAPIWRRRKKVEGFDVLFIDETHLFNFNEISVFHHLCKDPLQPRIVFAIDKAQAVGDRGLEKRMIVDFLGIKQDDVKQSSKLQTIFRSSPDIVKLAFNILSAGATLFTNFENPIEKLHATMTFDEEKKATKPVYQLVVGDDNMISTAFRIAESEARRLDTSKANILMVATTGMLLEKIQSFAAKKRKPIEVLKMRGDLNLVKKAQSSNRFVIAGIDYVGGLEFESVILVGVDKSRVPPSSSQSESVSYHFLNYAWHNRVYVAVSRAKYSVTIVGDKSRGESPMLTSGIKEKLIDLK